MSHDVLRAWSGRDFLAELGLAWWAVMGADQAHRRLLNGHYDRYYTYILWRSDLDRPIPFYVGKGIRQRIAAHRTKLYGSKNPDLRRILDEHRLSDLPIFCTAFASGLSNAEALACERELIAKIGRIADGSGPLTNILDGGAGASGSATTKGRVFAHGRRVRRVVVQGIEYPTLTIAALETGAVIGTLYSRINAGWDGYYYADEGPKPRRRTKAQTGALNSIKLRKPVVADGVTYPSMSECSRVTGFGKHVVSWRCRSANFPDWKFASATG